MKRELADQKDLNGRWGFYTNSIFDKQVRLQSKKGKVIYDPGVISKGEIEFHAEIYLERERKKLDMVEEALESE